MRSARGIIIDKAQAPINRFGDGRRRVIACLLPGGRGASVIQCLSPRILIVREGLLFPGKLRLLENDVDAMMGRRQRLPLRTTAASIFPIPCDVFQLDAIMANRVVPHSNETNSGIETPPPKFTT